ncbi:MAG: MFS transporter [Betaproteobacteria bacterium]|nr:MFS transporter [Betaproteobacteria bacterium]
MSADQLTPTAHVSPTEDATYRKVTWRLIPLLLVCYIIAYLDRVNVGFAKLQMASELGFSDAVYGLGAGMFFIGYFFFEVPSNIILHNIGARTWIARIMVSWGIISGGMMFIQTETQFYVMRFLLGLAEAGFFPGIILYLTYWYPAHRRGRIISLFMTGIPLAGVVGGPVSGWIMKSWDQYLGMQGWQWMFFLEAIPAVLFGVIVYFYLNDRIQDAKWLTDEERAMLAKRIADEDQHVTHMPILEVLKNKRVWVMSSIYFSMAMSLYGVSFWLPTLIKGMGVTDNFSIGLLSAIPWFAGAIAMVLFGRSADRHKERRWHVVTPMLMAATGLTLSVVLASDVYLSFMALILACMGIVSAIPLFWSLPTAFLAGAAAAAGIAAINSIANLAGFLAPYLVGWLKQATQSTDSGMYLLAVVLVIGAAVTLTIPAKLVNR